MNSQSLPHFDVYASAIMTADLASALAIEHARTTRRRYRSIRHDGNPVLTRARRAMIDAAIAYVRVARLARIQKRLVETRRDIEATRSELRDVLIDIARPEAI